MTKACQVATNYTAAHESLYLRNDLKYPDNHIEVNNRLTWWVGLLDKKFPDAKYVYLTRDPEAVAISHEKNCMKKPARIIEYWRRTMRMGWKKHKAGNPKLRNERPAIVDCREYVAACNGLIEVFLRSPKRNGEPRDWFHVDIDDPESFRRFWLWAGLEGDLDKAMDVFNIRTNVRNGPHKAGPKE